MKRSLTLAGLTLAALLAIWTVAVAGDPKLWLEHDGKFYPVQVGPATQPATQPALPPVVTIDPPATLPGSLLAKPSATRPTTAPTTRPTEGGTIPATSPSRPVLATRVVVDYKGVRDAVSVSRGKSATFADLVATNFTGSWFSQALYDGSVVTIRNVHVPRASRYGVYAEGRLAQPGFPLVADRAVATVIIEDSEFGTSDNETPVRFVEGIHAILRRVTSVEGSKIKNGQCLRAHGYITEIEGGTFGWSIFGPQSDAKNPPHSRTKLVSIKGAKFVDGIRLTKGIEQVIIDGCEIDLGGNWLNKHPGGHVEDLRTQILIRNTAIRGPPEKIDFGNADVVVENVTLNGKPFRP